LKIFSFFLKILPPRGWIYGKKFISARETGAKIYLDYCYFYYQEV